MRDIEANRYYIDAAGSVIDPALRARNDAAVRPLRDFRRALTPSCAVEWLQTWAEADALLGEMSSAQAHYERKWSLAAAATAYLTAKRAPNPVIESWLLRVADEVQRFAHRPGVKKNNHYYWAGLAVGTAGAAAESPSHWAFARRVYYDAMASIGPDGTLPLELARGDRALHYHWFAHEALARLHALAATRGERWDDAGLRRLASLARGPVIDGEPGGERQESGAERQRTPSRQGSGK